MEAHLTGASSDQLLDGLKFGPPQNTSNYVLEIELFTFSRNQATLLTLFLPKSFAVDWPNMVFRIKFVAPALHRN